MKIVNSTLIKHAYVTGKLKGHEKKKYFRKRNNTHLSIGTPNQLFSRAFYFIRAVTKALTYYYII